MASRPKRVKFIGILIAVVVVGIAAANFVPYLQTTIQGPLEFDEASDRLAKLLDDVTWREQIVDRAAPVTLGEVSLDAGLPRIDTFPLVVNPPSQGAVTVEIFVSTEKSGTGDDGWMVEAANAFNKRNKRLKDGRVAKVRIRKIASGTGYQFIGSRKYLPDGFSPSNHLWVRMAEARGVPMTPIREKTVGNIAGIVMKSDKAKELTEQAGSLTVPAIIEAVAQGNLVAGYTNPFASSTGLNFLVTVLATFGDGDEARMLSPDVVSAFEQFQRGVPFVAMTTLQMRESVRRDGSLDAFVMEYQTFDKTEELSSGYEFIPFGIRHDNPLYAVGNLDPEKLEALELFADFLDQDTYQRRAAEYGFNPKLDYTPPFETPDGRLLVDAQKIWKEKKDAGRPIAAVFLSDVSGSMRGTRLNQLKKALIDGSNFISTDNSIGLVAFDSDVRVLLPIKPFSYLHKSSFHAAVQGMDAAGNTAMYDGIAVALSMLVEEKLRNPNAKPVLFVLTDGATNRGMEFEAMSRVIEGLQIPVYTIGFEANIDELNRVSRLVEAASLNAGEGDVRYKIGALFNAQM